MFVDIWTCAFDTSKWHLLLFMPFVLVCCIFLSIYLPLYIFRCQFCLKKRFTITTMRVIEDDPQKHDIPEFVVPIRISLIEGDSWQGCYWTKGSSWLSWSHHFKIFTVTTMTWLTVMEYLCHKWPQIWSTDHIRQVWLYEEFEDTKGVIGIRKSKKKRQHNGQKKKHKWTNNDLQNIHIKLKDQVTRTQLKTGGELRCSGRVSSSCSTSYGVYISQLIQYSRACGSYQDFLDSGFLLTMKLLNQGLLLVKLKSSLQKLSGRHHDL
jgi:hypothetical protein